MLSGAPRSSAIFDQFLTCLELADSTGDAWKDPVRRPGSRVRRCISSSDVALFQRNGMFRHVRSEFASGTQSGGQDVALRVRLGIFGTHDSVLDQASHVGMIAGEARTLSRLGRR